MESFSNKHNYDIIFLFWVENYKEFGVDTDLNIMVNYSNIAILAFLFFYNHVFYNKSIMKENFSK